MAYLRKKDYLSLISVADLDVITGSDDTILTNKEKASQEEVSSFLRHRYEVGLIFKDIKSYSDLTQFNTADLVEWTESTYSAVLTYNIGARVVYSGSIYKCNTNGTTGIWNASKWDFICLDKLLYYCNIPCLGVLPSESVTYTSSKIISGLHQITGWNKETYSTLYFERYDGYVNIYLSASDRTTRNNKVGYFKYDYQGLELPYTAEIQPGSYPYNLFSGYIDVIGFANELDTWSVSVTKNWTLGDNRNQKLVEIMLDVTLYHLYTRIQPRNIPTHVVNRYDGGTEKQTAGAIGYLKMIQKGTVQLDLPIHKDDERGQSIVFGSNPRQNYNY